MEIVAIIISLVLLVTFAYRGYSVILFAPIFALFSSRIRPSRVARVHGVIYG